MSTRLGNAIATRSPWAPCCRSFSANETTLPANCEYVVLTRPTLTASPAGFVRTARSSICTIEGKTSGRGKGSAVIESLSMPLFAAAWLRIKVIYGIKDRVRSFSDGFGHRESRSHHLLHEKSRMPYFSSY